MNKYKDIINLNYQKSNKYKQMSLYDRAAQFMPFQALTGYDDEIKESGRIVDKKIKLNNEEKLNINNKLNEIKNNLNNQIKIEYFVKDKTKNGGKYIKKNINIKKIDEINKKIITFNEIINFEDMISLEYSL